MPIYELKREAIKHGYAPGSNAYNAYVYGTERKIEARRRAKRARTSKKRASTRKKKK